MIAKRMSPFRSRKRAPRAPGPGVRSWPKESAVSTGASAAQPARREHGRPPGRGPVPATASDPRRRARLGGVRDASASARSSQRRTGRESPAHGACSAPRAWSRAGSWRLVLRFAALIERALMPRLVDAIVDAYDIALEVGERWLTPERALVGVIVVAAACLGVSQFVAYRGVEVGQPHYSAVSSIAPAPQTDRIDAGAAHAYVLAAARAARDRDRRGGAGHRALAPGPAGRRCSALLGIAVSLAIDLPKGLDAGTAGTAFEGANATLAEGFYAQIFASAALVLCGWVLSARPAAKRRAQPQRRQVRTLPGRRRRAGRRVVAGRRRRVSRLRAELLAAAGLRWRLRAARRLGVHGHLRAQRARPDAAGRPDGSRPASLRAAGAGRVSRWRAAGRGPDRLKAGRHSGGGLRRRRAADLPARSTFPTPARWGRSATSTSPRRRPSPRLASGSS